MSNWVQGGGQYVGGTGISITLTGVSVGNCLVVTFSMWKAFTLSHGFPKISDDKGNIWLPVCMSPVQDNVGDTSAYQEFTFAAYNVAAGDTLITVNATTSGQMCILVDEFSGVAHVNALNQFTYASTEFGSGSPSISSGSINTVAGEILYSAGFCNGTGETISGSGSFTQRTYVTGTWLSAASFTAPASGGADSNTVTCSPTPGTVHVTLLALSPTPISSPIVQWSCDYVATITGPTINNLPYPSDNTAGNLLIAVAQLYERTDAVITDTNGNIWTMVYTSPIGTNDTIVMAYSLNCNAGANTVTINTTTGGTDDYIGLIIAEYNAVTAFTASSKGTLLTASTADTGNIGVTIPPALLISCFMDSSSPTAGVAVPLGSRRLALSSPGFEVQQNMVLQLSDQIKNSPGTYNDVFDITPLSGQVIAGILGFTLSLSLSCPIDNTGIIGVEYFSSLVASGGVPPYTFAIIGGALPPDLVLDPSTGVISGIPTTEGVYLYQAQVTDSIGATSIVTCEIAISAIPLSTTPFRCANVKPTGPLYTLEVTRDLDADWDDESTFWITQDVPLPFTLRGLVMRLSYNPD